MTIEYTDNLALLCETISVEDAEELLQWTQQHPAGRIDLAGCGHLHAAVLQVLMASGAAVAAWPEEAGLRSWLASALGAAGTPSRQA